jgi:DNA polymerase III alpha subunit
MAFVELEDITGKMDVAVWSDVYNRTTHLWEEGMMVVVDGSIRSRSDDQVSVSCKSAYPYQASSENEVGEKLHNSVAPNGSHQMPAQAHPPCKISVTLTQTGDQEADIAMLEKVVNIFQGSPGRDHVCLNLVNGRGAMEMDMPDLFTSVTPELQKKLAEIAGEASILVTENGKMS